ncbi:hypothetical protein BJ742DRAFT_854098 [Cladochytrium replicatum]|nr:hypothetical protein BJ742DRAFT_854098 [Cladochytrium replicatum]
MDEVNQLSRCIKRIPNFTDAALIKDDPAVYAGLHSVTLQKRFVKIHLDPQKTAAHEMDALKQLQKTGSVPRAQFYYVKVDERKMLAIPMDDAGVSLRSFVDATTKRDWTVSYLLGLIKRIIVTVDSIHAESWTHGQISPDTLFLLDRTVRLIDWSKATPVGENINGRAATAFAAPEATAPRPFASTESDIFSTGKVVEWLVKSRKVVRQVPEEFLSTIKAQMVFHMTAASPKDRPALSDLLTFVNEQIASSPSKMSLYEKALNQLVLQVNMDPENNMSKLDDQRGGVVFTDVFSKLHYLTALYVLENGYSNNEVRDIDSLHDWYDKKERGYREMFAIDRENEALDNPYALLNDVFGTSLRYTKQPLTEKESSYFFCFQDGLDSTPSNSDLVVPSFEVFNTNFSRITCGMLRHIDWSNVFVAGGSVLAALQPDLDIENSTFFNSDIDLFFTGLTLDRVESKITSLYDAITRAVKEDAGDNKGRSNVIVVRNLRSITLIASYPARQIQIVFRLFSSPAEVLMGFDIDSCAFGFDGKTVWALPRALRALTRRYNLVDMTRRSASYEYRLMKYGKRGFASATPNVDVAAIKREPIKGGGLAKLITMETPGFLTREFHRGKYKDKETKLKIAQVIGADRKAERLQTVTGEEFSHYQFIKIPYGRKWGLRSIKQFMDGFTSHVYWAAHYGSPLEELPYRSFYLQDGVSVIELQDSSKFLNPAENIDGLFDIDDNDSRITPFDYQINGINKLLRKQLDNFSIYGGRVDFLSSWVTVNPGKQLLMTGSFEPIVSSFEEWVADAYAGVPYERRDDDDEVPPERDSPFDDQYEDSETDVWDPEGDNGAGHGRDYRRNWRRRYGGNRRSNDLSDKNTDDDGSEESADDD